MHARCSDAFGGGFGADKEGSGLFGPQKNILDCGILHVLEWWFADESSVHWFAPKVVTKFYVLKYVTGARTTTGA